MDDTVVQLRSVHPSALKKPLKVKFDGEEGVDAGGVRKEFFQLLSHAIFDVNYGVSPGTVCATLTDFLSLTGDRLLTA